MLCSIDSSNLNSDLFTNTHIHVYPWVSSSVLIALFIIERLINHYKTKKETKRKWYLSVLIEPSIDNIACFYKDVYKSYRASSSLLKSKITDDIKLKEFNGLLTQENGNFQKLKREFESKIIFPIQLSYPKVGNDLTYKLLELEDIFTSNLDKQIFDENGFLSFQDKVANNRAEFLQILYHPIK